MKTQRTYLIIIHLSILDALNPFNGHKSFLCSSSSSPFFVFFFFFFSQFWWCILHYYLSFSRIIFIMRSFQERWVNQRPIKNWCNEISFSRALSTAKSHSHFRRPPMMIGQILSGNVCVTELIFSSGYSYK